MPPTDALPRLPSHVILSAAKDPSDSSPSSSPTPSTLPPTPSLLATLLAIKLTVLLLVFLAYALLPFFTDNYAINFVDPAYEEPSLASAFSTWDAQHYLYLSENGYHPGQMSNAFFPLLPALIHLATPLTGGSSLIAGLVVANLASLLGLFVLFKFLTELCGRALAENTLLLYLAFPTAFFFSLIYSESVFMLLVASFFLLLFRNRPGWAAVPAALAPLARPEGVLLLVPFGVWYLVHTQGDWAARSRQLLSPRILPALAPLAGLGVYLAYMRLTTGNALEMLDAMRQYVSAHSLAYWLHPSELAQALGEWPLALHGFTNSVIDRLIFLAFLLLLVPMFRRLPAPLAWYALVVGILNVASGTFMSYSRYVLLAFPVFLTAAILLQRPTLRWLRLPLLFLFVLVQGLFVTMQALSYWVA
ncbi:MAG TPA: hypothetical protein VKU60_05215 [Chloroflexota bacterium]|nr:hypothetical protein [Chloroflexota bacterium]